MTQETTGRKIGQREKAEDERRGKGSRLCVRRPQMRGTLWSRKVMLDIEANQLRESEETVPMQAAPRAFCQQGGPDHLQQEGGS